MITETPSLQKQVQPEGRFVNLIKQEFIKHAKEINRLEKDVDYKYYTKDEVDIAISEALADLLSTSADIIESLDDIEEVIDSKLDKNSPDYVKEVVVDGQNVVVTTGDNRTSVSQLQIQIPEVPTKTSDLINDSNYISEVRWSNIINRPVLSPVATNGSYTDLYDLPVIPEKTSELVNDSGYITGVSWDEVTDKPEFATVATSGSYLDLSNTPTIPTKVSDLTNDTGYITGVSWNEVTGKPNFATVATSGSYTDLSNKPTIPTVPTNVSAFNNDSGYITGVAWNDITNKPSTFPPSSHNHNNQYPIINRSGMTSIEMNTDLNTLKIPGTYFTTGGNTGSTIHASLSNSPTGGSGGGFMMYVIAEGPEGNAYPKQVLYMYNGDIYERTYGVSSWGEWHKRAYTDSDITGNAATATALTTSAGSATNPVYFSDGKPVATTYTLEKSVPSDAVFTDTVYIHPTTSGNKHIPSGGSAGNILKWSSDGTAVWGDEQSLSHLFDLSLTNATAIPANADLDDYKTPGVYYAPDSTRAKTLSNCPHTSSGFKLVVMENGSASSYKCQYIYAYNAKGGAYIYVRSYGTSSTGWYPWKKVEFDDHNHNDLYPIISNSGRTEIVSDTDLNTITTPGTYFTSGGNSGSAVHQTLLNSPTNGGGGGFLMYVISTGVNNGYPKQIIYMYNGDVYERTKKTSTWGEWHKRVYEDDIQTYTAGTGIAISSSNVISNSGVRSITTGSANGTISVNGTDVSVTGLGSAAYTASGDYVTLADTQNITGRKTFKSSPYYRISTLIKGNNPSSTTYPLWSSFFDGSTGTTEKNRFGAIGCEVNKYGKVRTSLTAYKNVADSTDSAALDVHYPTSGNPYATAPTPDLSSDTNHIATTEWVNTKLDDYEVDLSNKPRTIEFIAGTQTAATPSFTGVSGDSALYDGKIIAYYLPFAGTSAGDTLELTLSNNTTTGAKPVWYRNQVTRLTTHYPANAIILMVYDVTDDCWICGGQYNTTYSSMTVSEMDAGTATTGRLVTAARLHNKIKDMINDAMTANGLNTI